MSLSSQEDVVDADLSPLRGNLSSPELPSTPVFRYPLRRSGVSGSGGVEDSDREEDDDDGTEELADTLDSRDVSTTPGGVTPNMRPTTTTTSSNSIVVVGDNPRVEAINALDASVDLFQPQPGLDDTIGQSPPLLDGSFRPPGASSSAAALRLEATEEDMQLQISESDDSL